MGVNNFFFSWTVYGYVCQHTSVQIGHSWCNRVFWATETWTNSDTLDSSMLLLHSKWHLWLQMSSSLSHLCKQITPSPTNNSLIFKQHPHPKLHFCSQMTSSTPNKTFYNIWLLYMTWAKQRVNINATSTAVVLNIFFVHGTLHCAVRSHAILTYFCVRLDKLKYLMNNSNLLL